jgi:hypothetical protein
MIALPYYLIAVVAAVVSLPAQAVRSLRARRIATPTPAVATC